MKSKLIETLPNKNANTFCVQKEKCNIINICTKVLIWITNRHLINEEPEVLREQKYVLNFEIRLNFSFQVIKPNVVTVKNNCQIGIVYILFDHILKMKKKKIKRKKYEDFYEPLINGNSPKDRCKNVGRNNERLY